MNYLHDVSRGIGSFRAVVFFGAFGAMRDGASNILSVFFQIKD